MNVDYASSGNKQYSDAREDVDKAAQPNEEEATVKATVLVGRDAKSRVWCAIPVLQKGFDIMERSLREGLRFLDFLGYTSVVAKSYQDVALGARIGKMKAHRGEQT